MMSVAFNGSSSTAIVPIHVNDEPDRNIFYNKLYFLVRHIHNHNVLIIGEDINAKIGKDGNNKFFLHKSPNRNGEFLTEFSLENSLHVGHDVGHSLCGCVWVPVRESLCLFFFFFFFFFFCARKTHKVLVCEMSHETGRERGKEGPREERRRQSAEGSRRGQSAGESSQEKDGQEMRVRQSQ